MPTLSSGNRAFHPKWNPSATATTTAIVVSTTTDPNIKYRAQIVPGLRESVEFKSRRLPEVRKVIQKDTWRVLLSFLGSLISVRNRLNHCGGARFLGAGLFSLSTAHEKADRNKVQTERASGQIQKEKADYIRNYLELYGFQARYHDSAFDERIPGVDFKLRNRGSRTLNEVDVRVYFKDRAGKVIAEENYYPVLVTRFGSDNDPLKPGYIWQMQRGRFYAAKKVPSEWLEGSASPEITDIEFADSTSK